MRHDRSFQKKQLYCKNHLKTWHYLRFSPPKAGKELQKFILFKLNHYNAKTKSTIFNLAYTCIIIILNIKSIKKYEMIFKQYA
ncbi:MAG: hypothetical protein LBR79_03420 [Oscillospiraceae bacterium]|nr:hypothetical protein [Oscillospiraceae bacterium]